MGPNLSQIADDFGFNKIERDFKLGGEISLVFWLIEDFLLYSLAISQILFSRKPL